MKKMKKGINTKNRYKTKVTNLDKYRLSCLRKKILKTYQKLGETSNSIDTINKLLKDFYPSFQHSVLYKTSVSKTYQAIKQGDYQRFSLIDDKLIKMSLHIMPKGAQIPMHAHPGMFCITLVEQGRMGIKHDSWGRMTPLMNVENGYALSAGETSIGLPIKNNLHQIRAESDVLVFFSLRLKLNPQDGFNSLKQKFALPSFLISLVLPFLSLGTASNAIGFNENALSTVQKDYAQMVLSSEKAAIFQQKNAYQADLVSIKKQAETLRKTGQYEEQVEAVKFYQKAAGKGDAESQYWLGVMFLDGSGITENDDEALEWIAKSAQQNYQPAEKLLAHLLATDFDMDC